MTQTTSTRGGVTAARVCTILAFVFAPLAVLVSPLIFGLAGLVLGVVAGYLGDRPLGYYAAAAALTGGIIGVVINTILLTA